MRQRNNRGNISHVPQEEIETNHDLIATYRHHITTTMNQANVSHFLRSFNSRSALEVERPVPGGNINARTLKLVPVVISDTLSTTSN